MNVGYDSYLNFDSPLVLNLNPFFLLEDDPTPARNNQITRAASLTISALSFARAVRREELPPDTSRGQPLCMYQYSRLFGTARVPTDKGCKIDQDHDSKHIVVLCRGQFYWFNVLDDDNDLIITEKDLILNLSVISNDAEQTPIQDGAKSALGVLTTEKRRIWSGLRGFISAGNGSNNSDCLTIVDNALFVLCLDDTEPANTAELCTNMLCGTSQVQKGVQVGTCTNRWYDKLQIIICKNGSAGINFEHTGLDGHTVLRFASDIYTDTILRFARSINDQAPSLWKTTSPDPSKKSPCSFGNSNPMPRKLEWDVKPELAVAVRFAETRLADLIQQNEFQTLDFMHFGKSFITSMGFSPDAFMQMAFQAAYYGLYGRVESTYEPAMTKLFYHGRTEAIRSVSHESVDFVRCFWGANPAAKKIDALRNACEHHVISTKECSKAQGAERHLYALFCLWQLSAGTSTDRYHGVIDTGDCNDPPFNCPGQESSVDGIATSMISSNPPAIFVDGGWDRINNTILSTSNCGNPSLRHFGFGPTNRDGFGIGYIIKDGSIAVCASSKHRQTRRFVDAIEAYLLEIRRLLQVTLGLNATIINGNDRSKAEDGVASIKTRGRLLGSSPPTGGRRDEMLRDEHCNADCQDDIGGCKSFASCSCNHSPQLLPYKVPLISSDRFRHCRPPSNPIQLNRTLTLFSAQTAFSMQACYRKH